MIAITESAECRTRALLACLGESMPSACGHCDRCARPVAAFDGTLHAQKLLSAVLRTGQRFGAGHIISVLRGQPTEMTERHAHHKLPTWGVGADRPAGFWRGVIRQLVARGALQPSHGEYPALSFVEEVARPILRGESRMMLLAEDAPQPPREARRRLESAAPSEVADPAQFEALRAWRSAEAKNQAVPPYIIFPDSVLRDIAATRPADREQLGMIRGVGAAKLARYGAAVLGVLAAGR
jgi:ATP-dependent DNA helicase RecQ